MSEIKIIIESADKTKRAEVDVDDSMGTQDLLNGTISNWALPTDNTTYAIHNKTQQGKLLSFSSNLSAEGVRNGDTLTVSWQTEGGCCD
jgi:hypothetical protein